MVKRGYKQTEVGVIPEDWLTPQLQQIAEEESPICYGIVQVGPFTATGVPVLAIKNLNLDYSANIHRASIEVERPYVRSRVQPGDIIVSVKGTTGRVGIVPSHFSGNISRDLARIRPRREIAPDLVHQMLQSDLAQRRLVTAAVGTTRMELSIAILKQVRIPLPPTKAEQEAIAEALSGADALIESLEQLLAKKRQVKQGAVQELLSGRRRLPGFEVKHGFKWTEVGAIPEDWEVVRLRDLIRQGPQNGYSGRSSDDAQGTPTLSLAATSSGRLILNDRTVKHLQRAIPTDSPLFLELFDVLVQRSNTVDLVGTTAIFDGPASIYIYPDLMMRLRFRAHETAEWFWRIANSALGRRFFRSVAAGSTGSMPKISGEALREMPLPLPPLPEQAAIAAILSDMDAEIDALEAKLTKARQIKQGMMQELLTGRIRLV